MFTKKIGSIALAGAMFVATSGVVVAQGLTIGAVKQAVPMSFCGVYLPGGEQPMVILLLPDDSTSKKALVNVNGRDVSIKQVSFRWTKPEKRSVAVYQGKDLTVTIQATIVETNNSGQEVTLTEDRVTFKQGKRTKTIQSNGACAI